MKDKKLYRSLTDKEVAGVCGGIADYFEIDSTIVRLIWAFLFVVYGAGLFAYIVAWIVMPEEPARPIRRVKKKKQPTPADDYYEEIIVDEVDDAEDNAL